MTPIRETVRDLLKPLQRARPRTPFWNIPAHRIPTLRLYKQLLQQAPTDAIRFRIRLLWNQNKPLTSVTQTQCALRQGYKYLDIFQRANAGDALLQTRLTRYSNLIDVRCEKEYWEYLSAKELVWRAKLRYRPIVTGACFRSSIYHKPLPRMINQPTKISQMIGWRYKAHARRVQRHQAYLETLSDLKLECHAEGALLESNAPHSSKDTVFGAHYYDWVAPYKKELNLMQATFDRGALRAKTPFPQSLLDQLKTARTERVLNKTRERRRELRGEITPSLLKKLRKGPPAHILSRMSPTRRLLDKVARSPSEVGFVAIAKKKLGRKMKNPLAALVEESPEKKIELDTIAQGIHNRNRLRRRGLLRSFKYSNELDSGPSQTLL